jgi:hypothetical protein
MARYVVEFEGEILVKRPLKNIREAKASRSDWAAELGGAIGSVHEREIKILKLTELRLDRPPVGNSRHGRRGCWKG